MYIYARGYTAQEFWKKFPNKSWNKRNLWKLLKKTSVQLTGSHGAAVHEHRECDPVSDLMLVGKVHHRYASQYLKCQEILEFVSHHCHVIHNLIRATHREENNMPVWLLVYSRVVYQHN